MLLDRFMLFCGIIVMSLNNKLCIFPIEWLIFLHICIYFYSKDELTSEMHEKSSGQGLNKLSFLSQDLIFITHGCITKLFFVILFTMQKYLSQELSHSQFTGAEAESQRDQFIYSSSQTQSAAKLRLILRVSNSKLRTLFIKALQTSFS